MSFSKHCFDVCISGFPQGFDHPEIPHTHFLLPSSFLTGSNMSIKSKNLQKYFANLPVCLLTPLTEPYLHAILCLWMQIFRNRQIKVFLIYFDVLPAGCLREAHVANLSTKCACSALVWLKLAYSTSWIEDGHICGLNRHHHLPSYAPEVIWFQHLKVWSQY